MMTTPGKLGRLERVPLRSIWSSESGAFTPWLATEENIRILGDAIGMELEVEAQEKGVGPFRADILCKNVSAAGSEYVLIENQLERTDHAHLGQLLTYAAGLEAVTIVWIAERFTEEHRAALDWLNSITEEKFRFFGLEVELWRIGNSPAAPKFNVVCEPNDWAKSVQTAARGELTEGKRLQVAFWTVFVSLLSDRNYRITDIPKPQPVHSLVFTAKTRGFWIATVASSWDDQKNAYGGELRVELCVDGEHSKVFLSLLRDRQKQIEAELGEPVIFYEKPDVRMCRVLIRRSVVLEDRSQWDVYAEWLYERLLKFHKVFRPIVAGLKPPQELGAGGQEVSPP